jgi:hypothetical protein
VLSPSATQSDTSVPHSSGHREKRRYKDMRTTDNPSARMAVSKGFARLSGAGERQRRLPASAAVAG